MGYLRMLGGSFCAEASTKNATANSVALARRGNSTTVERHSGAAFALANSKIILSYLPTKSDVAFRLVGTDNVLGSALEHVAAAHIRQSCSAGATRNVHRALHRILRGDFVV
jgi:hypothetical protein